MGSPRHARPIAPGSIEIVPSDATAGASRFVDSDESGRDLRESGESQCSPNQCWPPPARPRFCSASGRPGAIADAAAPAATGTTALPEIVVEAPKQVAGKPKQRAKPRAVARRAVSPRTASSPPTASPPPVSPRRATGRKERSASIRPAAISSRPIGTTSNTISHDTIQDLPQGTNTPVEQGAAAGARRLAGFRRQRLAACPQRSRQRSIPDQRHHAARRRHRLRQHLRHQLRRQHGTCHRRAAGRIRPAHGRPRRHPDHAPILSTTAAASACMAAAMAPSRPSFEYGGTFGGNCPTRRPRRVTSRHLLRGLLCRRQYYFTGRYLQNTVGIENPTPAYNAIHDFTQQEKGFAYMSRPFVDPTSRLSLIARHLEQQLSDSQ